MKLVLIAVIVGVSVASIIGIIQFTNFDPNQIPTGLI